MEILGILLAVTLILGLPVASIVMAALASGRTKAFEAQIATLSRESAALRDEIASLRSAFRSGAAPAAPLEEPVPEEQLPGQVAEPPVETPDAPLAETGPEAAPPPLPPVSEPVAPAQPVAGGPDLESRIGGRWSVMLGGLATALGAVLLVRYTIEAGLLGPAARIALGALLAAALFAGGEFLRRRDRSFSFAAIPGADIPAILTAAGVVAAFATAYAAYALYGFLSPAAAFIVLTLVGLAALALSAVHGPGIAALGAVGSYATPILVSSDNPNLYALVLHVLVVTGSVFGVAIIRNWLWLAWLGVAGSAGWTALAASAPGAEAGVAGLALILGSAVLYASTFGYAQHGSPLPLKPPYDDAPDKAAAAAFAALAAAFFFQLADNAFLPLPLAPAALAAFAAACAVLWPGLAPVGLVAAFVAVLGVAAQDLKLAFDPGVFGDEDLRKGIVPADIPGYARSAFMVAMPAGLVLAWGSLRAGRDAPRPAGWLAWGLAGTAFLSLVFAYLRIAPFEQNLAFGGLALVLAAGFVLGTEALVRMRPDDPDAHAPAAFAVAASGLLAFGLAVSIDTGWFPLAFALAVAGVAVVHGFRPLAVLPWIAVAGAVVSAGTIAIDHPFQAGSLGDTPFLNRLIPLIGLPAVALVFAGETMRRRGANIPASIVAALGMALAGLFVALELRHWLSSGDMTAETGLAELSAWALAALCFALGLQRVATLTGARLYANATTVAGVVAVAIIAAGLFVGENPLFTDDPVGATRFFNLLLPAYLLNGLAAAAVAVQARPFRPRSYVLAYAGLAGALLFLFVTLTVRHAFQGSQIGMGRVTSDAEFWTYSAAWLALGVALLALGHFLRSFPIRVASAAVIVLTVLKVFILDLSALTGAMRAFSFIGLGLILIAIGRFYQVMLTRKEEPAAEPPPPPAPAPDA